MTNVTRFPKALEAAKRLEDYLAKRGPRGDGENEPTPERLAKVNTPLRPIIEQTASGQITGMVAWRITPVLADLLRRKTLTEEEFEAADKFITHYYYGMYRGPSHVKYDERLDPSTSDMNAEERRAHYASRALKAMAAVHQDLQPAIRWLVMTLGENVPLSHLGYELDPNCSPQTASQRGSTMLKMCCLQLCRHYKIRHPYLERAYTELERYMGSMKMLDHK